MKTKIFLLLFLAIAKISHSQVIIVSDTVVRYNTPMNGTPQSLTSTIYNNTANPVTINWTKSNEALLTGWSLIGICDPITCYPAPATGNYQFTINAGDSSYIYTDVSATPTAVNGTSYVTVTTNYGDMVFQYNSSPNPVACGAGFWMYEDTAAAPHTYVGVNTCFGNIVSYDWDWGDGSPHDTAAYPSHTYATAGIYNICLVVSDGLNCTDTFCSNETINKVLSPWYTINFLNPTSVKDISRKTHSIYPNPASDFITFSGNNNLIYNIDIIDISGKVIRSTTANATDKMDISYLSDGVYFLKISDETGKKEFSKFIKK